MKICQSYVCQVVWQAPFITIFPSTPQGGKVERVDLALPPTCCSQRTNRMGNKSDLAPETKNAQALRQIDSMAGGLSPGIHPSTTYVRDENYELIDARHSYGRDENPGFAVAEKVLAELEGGSAALLFSSGMSAAMAVVQSLQPGDRIVAPKIMYWGLRKWLITFCDK